MKALKRSFVASAPVAPAFVGPSNVELVIGWRWRYTRDFAVAHGVPILRPAGKPLIRFAELAAAIELEARRAAPPAALSAGQELDAARAKLAQELAHA